MSQYTGRGRHSKGEIYDKNRSRNKNRKKSRGKRSISHRTRHAVDRYHQLEKSLDELGGDYESTGMLLEKIEQHPEIWNWKSDCMTSDIISYYDGKRRKEAWISICGSINVGFDEKNSEEKAEICQVVMEKWKNIRNCYARFVGREKYIGKNISSGKLSIYAKNLSFLSLISKAHSSFEDKVLPEDFNIVDTDEAKISETPVTVSEIKTEQGDCSYHNSSEMFEDFNIVDTDEAKISETPVTVSEIRTEQGDCSYHNSSEMFEDFSIVDTDEAKISETPVTVSEIRTEQGDCSYHNSSEMFESVDIEPELEGMKSLASETDFVMNFLKSLHPLIKDFNDDQKLKFQCETLNLIEEIGQTINQNIHDSSKKYLKRGISFSFYSPGNL